MPVETRYARKGDINIAYQVVGEGPVDLIFVNGLVAHMDLFWADPQATAMLRQFASFSRLILFDKPGTGLSDPVAGAPTIDQRVGDIEAVLDAVGSERAAVLGFSEGGPPSALFAATNPDRVIALILLATFAKATPSEDWFGGHDGYHRFWEEMEKGVAEWGSGHFARVFAPSWEDSAVRRSLAPVAERASASPGMARALLEAAKPYDVRGALGSISAPTLVLHAEEELIPIEIGRDLAERIDSARFVTLPGADHLPFLSDWKLLTSEVQELLTGTHNEPTAPRALRSVLFTDIVGSTELAAGMGDGPWRDLLAEHDRITGTEVARHGGELIKSLGDGALSAFESPAAAVRCGRALIEEMRQLDIELRAGVHTGECELIGDDLGGVAVHIGARISAAADASQVLVSGTVCDLVMGSGLEFRLSETRELKGVPGAWTLYELVGDNPLGSVAASSADHRAAALTPGPRETQRPIDSALVALARHAPGVSRAGLRLNRGLRRRRARAD